MRQLKFTLLIVFLSGCSALLSDEEHPDLHMKSRKCCEGAVSVLDYHWTCEDGKPINLTCSLNYIRTLNNEWGTYSHYVEGFDSKGRYIDAYGRGHIYREPYYCITSVIHSGSTDETNAIAYVCRIHAEEKDDYTPPTDSGASNKNENPIPLMDRLFPILINICNGSSAVVLGVTAAIYCFLRNIQDTHGTCIFHFTFCLCCFHSSLFYMMVFNPYGILPDLCLTNLYLRLYIFLSAFSWCTVVGFNSWIHVKSSDGFDEDTLTTRYRYFGYGTPAVLVFLSNLYAHGAKLYTEYKFEMDCYKHQGWVITLTCVLPVLTMVIANCFFYFDTQRRLWNNPMIGITSSEPTTRSKKLKYRLMLNGRLFFTLGIPWALFFLGYVISNFLYSFSIVYFLANITVFIVCAEGVFMFLILVVLRKRVLKGIFNYWLPNCNIFPDHWRTMVDSELDDTEINYTQGRPIDFEKDNVGTMKSNWDPQPTGNGIV